MFVQTFGRFLHPTILFSEKKKLYIMFMRRISGYQVTGVGKEISVTYWDGPQRLHVYLSTGLISPSNMKGRPNLRR